MCCWLTTTTVPKWLAANLRRTATSCLVRERSSVPLESDLGWKCPSRRWLPARSETLVIIAQKLEVDTRCFGVGRRAGSWPWRKIESALALHPTPLRSSECSPPRNQFLVQPGAPPGLARFDGPRITRSKDSHQMTGGLTRILADPETASHRSENPFQWWELDVLGETSMFEHGERLSGIAMLPLVYRREWPGRRQVG